MSEILLNLHPEQGRLSYLSFFNKKEMQNFGIIFVALRIKVPNSKCKLKFD